MEEFSTHDSEVAFLSLVLRNPALLDKVSVKPEMISSTVNSLVYTAILEVKEFGVPEAGMIKSYLDSRKLLDKAGGADWITWLSNQTYSEDNLSVYDKNIYDAYKARCLMEILVDSHEKINPSNVDSMVSDLMVELNKLGASNSLDGTETFDDALKNSWQLLKSRVGNPGMPGMNFGIENVNAATGGIMGGDLWYIGGRPSAGKTFIACNAILGAASSGIPCLFIEKETRSDQLVQRLMGIDSGVELTRIKTGAITQAEVDKLQETVKRIKSYPIYINTNFGADIQSIRNTIVKYVNGYGVKLVFIDYIQLLTEREDNQTAELGRISRMLKNLANDKNVGIVVLSQLSRNVESRDDKRPVMADMRQSGNLEEDADVIATLYRDVYYNSGTKFPNLMEFIIRKQRNGPVGMVALNFDATTGRITSE